MTGKPSNRLAAATLSLAVIGAFGAGAAVLAQNSNTFDPADYLSAYTHGDSSTEKGYRANPTDTNAEANRHGEEDEDERTDQHELEDAFSQLPPDDLSETVALHPTENASDRILVASGNGDLNAGSSATGSIVNGPVASDKNQKEDKGDSGNKGDHAGGTGEGEKDNGGTGSNSGYDVLPRDPIPDKKSDSDGWLLYVPVKGDDPSYNKTGATPTVSVRKYLFGEANIIYSGQILDAWTVFCSFFAGYSDPNDPWTIHEWICTRDEFVTDMNNPKIGGYSYFKIIDYPEIAPSEPFTITYQYRFSDEDEWQTGTLEYDPILSCLYILSGATNENGSADVLATSYYDPSSESTNYSSQKRFLPAYTMGAMKASGYASGIKDTPITKLMLGWMESGQPVGPFYDMSFGRHVVTPGPIVDLPDCYTAVFRSYWFDGELQVSPTGSLGLMQTLTGARPNSEAFKKDLSGKTTLLVPDGIETISIDEEEVQADVLAIPSSVLYVDTDSSRMAVWDAYQVAEDNRVYATTKDGILTNKEGSEYRGIPLRMKELEVPDSVTKVDFTPGNALEQITLEATDIESLPELDLDHLDACNIVVDDELFEDYITSHYGALNGSSLTISKASQPAVRYQVDHGMIYSGEKLLRVLDTNETVLTVKTPHLFQSGALEGNTSLKTIILGDTREYTLEDGCLKGSHVSLIVCQTEEQLAYVTERLNAAGAPSETKVVLMESNEAGYQWYIATSNGARITTLAKAPDTITEFNGSLVRDGEDADRVIPDVIGPNAFADCKSLRWVTLQEGTTRIGASAFSGCDNLEGVLIKEPESIAVENGTFAHCPSLRFMASMAKGAYFATEDIDPSSCRAYRLAGSTGYPGSFLALEEEGVDNDGNVLEPKYITGFEMLRQGDSYILYGMGDGITMDGAWLALASGSSLPSTVSLPTETVEIFSGAFANVTSSFTLNWNELSNLQYIDGDDYAHSDDYSYYFRLPGAFEGSAIESVHLGSSLHCKLFKGAFMNCPYLKSFSSDDTCYTEIADGVFSQCQNLSSVAIGRSSIHSAAFADCSSLKEIELLSPTPPGLTLYEGAPFSFLGGSAEEDADTLRLKVPEGSEDAYIKEWAFFYCGYNTYDSFYEAMTSSLKQTLGRTPTEIEVETAMADKLLIAENHLRKMLGMEPVETSSILAISTENGCTFVSKDGETRLISVSTDSDVIDLAESIPDSLEEVTIGANAFATCGNLKRVIIPDKVKGIHSGAFNDCPSGMEVVLPDAEAIPELIERTGFKFGSDTIKLIVREPSQNDYLKTWTWQLQGYDYEEQIIWEAYSDVLWGDASIENINEWVNMPFLASENDLRKRMGLESIEEDDIEHLASFCDVAAKISASFDYFDSGDDDIPGSSGAEPGQEAQNVPDSSSVEDTPASSFAIEPSAPSSLTDGKEENGSREGEADYLPTLDEDRPFNPDEEISSENEHTLA